MATTNEPAGAKPAPGGGASTGNPKVSQGGSRDAANATGRHSKDADHAPGSPAELDKAKGTEKAG